MDSKDENRTILQGDSDCPLSIRDQNHNIRLLTAAWGLIYLASPVTYVGTIQASLCARLGANDRLANLPSSAYLFATVLPILVVSCFPRASHIRSLLKASYALAALAGLLPAGCLLLPLPDENMRGAVVVAALTLHAAVMGCALGVAVGTQWEVLGRGVALERRGRALAWVFSLGPLLAVVASLGSQLVLSGRLNGFQMPAIDWLHAPSWRVPDLIVPSLAFPWNFAALFAASAPILGLAAFLSTLYRIPPPTSDLAPDSLLAGLWNSLRKFLSYRPILLATLAYILVYSGFMVINNITLNTHQALGAPPEQSAGVQLALRFSFKVAAGFGLGWLLVWTNPRTLLITTAALVAGGIGWATWIVGPWYLLGFGLLGAGELFGAYYPNYILGCTPASAMRKNMALVSLITVPVGFSGVIYGAISDALGADDKQFGMRASFTLALAFLGAAVILVLATLPAQPRPQSADVEN